MQEIESDSRAKGQNWSIWEVNISSPGPNGMNSKWVFFIHIILIIYLFMSISLLEEKKCNSILGFHDERVWVFMVSKLFKYIFAFDHVCYKLLYDCPLLEYMNITLNMFAIMVFCLIINFNMMFSFWSLFYNKSVIRFYSKRNCCCSILYNSFLKLC